MKLLRHFQSVRKVAAAAVVVFFGIVGALPAQAFIHPGGLHTLADLERMRTNVSLNVSQGSGVIMFNWPVAASGFTLESSPTLGSGAVWKPVASAPRVIGLNNQLTVPPTNSAMFFRLYR